RRVLFRSLARAVHPGALDEEDLAAHGRPGEAGRDARLGGALGHLGGEARRTEEGTKVIFRGDLPRPELALRDLHGDAADDAGDLPLEAADARFAGVVVDDGLDGLGLEGEDLRLDAVLLELLGYEVVARDVELLAPRVTRDLDDLHAVLEGRRDGVADVRRRDEHHLREVVGDLEVVIAEGVVLLR